MATLSLCGMFTLGKLIQRCKALWPAHAFQWPFSWLVFLICINLQCNLTWVQGNFRLKLQNSPKLPHMLDYIVMLMRKTNREKGYSDICLYLSYSQITVTSL